LLRSKPCSAGTNFVWQKKNSPLEVRTICLANVIPKLPNNIPRPPPPQLLLYYRFAKQYSGGFSSRQIFNVKVLLKGLPNNIEDYPRPEVVKVLLKKKLPFRVAFRLVGVLTSNA
jgi:hypothetical protein